MSQSHEYSSSVILNDDFYPFPGYTLQTQVEAELCTAKRLM